MLKIAFQMDPIAHVDIAVDTTFDIALEAFNRGHEIFVYEPSALSLEDGRARARAQKVQKIQRKLGEHVYLSDPEALDLHALDAIFLRQDPPFDTSYITTTHILEHVVRDVLVVNNPCQVRDTPEKLFITLFEDIMPPTLITSDAREVRSFFDKHNHDIIVKPLFGNGGVGVFRIRHSEENIASLMELFAALSRDPVMVQSFIPNVTNL